MEASGLLGGQYRHLCKQRELAEYMREGNAKNRRAMLRRRRFLRRGCGVATRARRCYTRCVTAGAERSRRSKTPRTSCCAARRSRTNVCSSSPRCTRLSRPKCRAGQARWWRTPRAFARRRATGRVRGGVRALTESHPCFPQPLAPARLPAGLLQGCFGSCRASAHGAADTG